MATYDLTSSIPAASSLVAGDILNCPYSGAYKTIELPKGTYKLQCWGAQGGSYSSSYYGGKGGYAIGTIILNEKSTVYLYAGGQGASVTSSVTGGAGGFNGGGSGGNGSSASKGIAGSGGGGASDIRINSTDLTNRVIVAGGGGGSSGPGCYGSSSLSVGTAAIGGAAGVAGNNGGESNYHGKAGGAGTTSGGGAGGAVTTSSVSNTDNTYYAGGGGGGGAGYYGGGGGGGGSLSSSSYRGKAGSAGTLGTGGAGGASYSSGKTAYYGSGGGSGGGGSSWTSSNLTSASSSNGNVSFIGTGGSNETGHAGNGYVRITIIEIVFENENGSKNLYIKTDEKCSLPSGYMQLPYIESTADQYINTGITGHSGLTVDLKFAVAEPPAESKIMGSCNSDFTNCYYPISFNNWHLGYGYGDNYTSIKPAEQETIYNSITVLEANKQSMLVNDMPVSYSTNASTVDNGVEMILFGINVDGSPLLSAVRIYYCKIFENNTLIRNFIPALRKSDGKAGMYDTVYKTFYDSNDEDSNFIYNNNAFLDEYTIYYIKGNDATINLGTSGTITNNNVVATPNDLLYFNGTNSELKLSTGITQGTYDFTIDWWEYQTANVNNCAVYGNESRFGCLIGYTYNDKVWSYLSSNNSSWDITGGSGIEIGTVQLNKWVHRACVRKKNVIYYFENGKLKNTITSSASITYPGTPVIGAYRDSAPHYWQGYLKHFRMSDCARWTSDFTPPSLEMGYGANYAKITESYIKAPNNQSADFDSNYYPLKYIESSGTQWINTNFTPTNNSSIFIDAEVFKQDTHAALCTARSSASTSANTIMILVHGDGYWCVDRGSTASNRKKFEKLSLTGRVNVHLNKHHISFNNGEFTNNYSATDNFTCANVLTLLCDQDNDRYYMKARLYSCQIWDDGTLIRNYIPAVRKSDGKAGLYDKVNGVFYTDAAGGNFIYNTQDIDDNTIYYIKGDNPTENLGKSGTITNNGIIALSNDVLYLNGGSYVSLSDSIIAGANDWTIDWWEYPLVYKEGSGVYHVANNTSIYYGCLVGYRANGNDVQAYASSNGSSWDILNAMQMGKEKLLAWTHRALVRKGSTFYAFENGKLISTVSSSSSIKAETPPLLGAYYSAANGFNGYLKHCRISNCARWTNDFTPPARSYGEPWKEIKSIYIKNNIPSGYTRLEYLESTGTQYTDTGLIPNQNTKTVIDCILPTTSDGSYYICGARQESYVGNYSLQTTSGMYYSKHGTADVSLSIPSIEHRMKFIKDGHVFSVDGNLGYNTPVDFTSPNSMYIFACNSAGSVYGLTPCKIYRVQIYQDGTNLSRDMVPVLRNSDGKTGFYDLINNNFYPNLDTTTEFNFIYSNGWEKIT